MEYRLDAYQRREDELAIEDGQAEARAYCWCCDQYVPAVAMGPLPNMTCAWCENDLRDVDEMTEECRADQAERKQTNTIHTGRGILAWLCQIR